MRLGPRGRDAVALPADGAAALEGGEQHALLDGDVAQQAAPERVTPVPCRETGDEECIEALVIAGEKRVQLRAHQWLHDEPHVPPVNANVAALPATSSSATAREVDVVLDVDVLVRELFELGEPLVQLAIAEARALGWGVPWS